MRGILILIAIFVCATLLPLRDGSCGNPAITNLHLGALSGGSTSISFDITWTNSWRSTAPGAPAPNNWDAAWVFVKFRKQGGPWKHASLNNTGHSAGSGTPATIAVGYPDTSSPFNIATNPGVGVFLYRSADGVGTFSTAGTSLRWNYAQDGITDTDLVDIRIFAIEMVYVPAGSFFAGDNATSLSSFKQGTSDNDPWYIGSENSITTTNSAGTGTGLGETAAEYYYPGGGSPPFVGEPAGGIFTIPASFPKGYQAHYMMKGEISQRQWVGFFNTLNDTQKTNRDITSSSLTGKNTDSVRERNNVSWTSGDATLPDRGGGATYEHVAMNWLSWGDVTAYLDWSGLRPMSELEFERAGRGPYRPVSGEFAWGSTHATPATSVTDAGLPTERAQNGANEHCSYSILGPLRVGSLAFGVATREASGAGYYGAMDLSGNLWELAVTVGHSAGRSFEGRYHGNGSVDINGEHNVPTWPAATAGMPEGWGMRGDSWAGAGAGTPCYGTISYRIEALYATRYRFGDLGGRGVRVAPQ